MGMLSTYRLQLCQCLQRRLFKWKVWTEMNKMVLNLSTAQAFVSRVTGSSGLALQPERKGIFWDNFYRWYVSMLIHFKELWFIAKWNLSQTLWQLSVMENAFLKKDFPPFCLCCLDDERGRYQIEEKKKIGKYLAGIKWKTLVKSLPDTFTFHAHLTRWKRWFRNNFPGERPQLPHSALLIITKRIWIYFQNK